MERTLGSDILATYASRVWHNKQECDLRSVPSSWYPKAHSHSLYASGFASAFVKTFLVRVIVRSFNFSS